MLSIEKMVSAINSDGPYHGSDCIIAFDDAYFFLRVEYSDDFGPTQLRGDRMTVGDITALYHKRRQGRIDAALERISNVMRAAGVGYATKRGINYAIVRDGGSVTELTEAQFVELAREHECFERNDPFFDRRL